MADVTKTVIGPDSVLHRIEVGGDEMRQRAGPFFVVFNAMLEAGDEQVLALMSLFYAAGVAAQISGFRMDPTKSVEEALAVLVHGYTDPAYSNRGDKPLN